MRTWKTEMQKWIPQWTWNPEADAEEGDAPDVEEAMDDVEEAIAELRAPFAEMQGEESVEEPRNGTQKWKNQ